MSRATTYTPSFAFFRAELNPVEITADENHPSVTKFAGFALRETGSAAATVNFRHGSDSGRLLWPVDLAADKSGGITFTRPIACSDGVYVEVTGDVEGVLLLWR